ncbi:MAG: prefoldin subunit beta [Candidatus Nanoarchaeia archaeon]|nr:prefoldin subunit beta [Candidatus Nanoarchaeia archaeon]
MSSKNQKEVQELQILEQGLQNILIQKQTFQAQMIEIENALKELEHSTGDCYKIVGNIMIKSDKSTLIKDLNGKKEIIELRIKTLEKQESKTKEQFQEKQKEAFKNIK